MKEMDVTRILSLLGRSLPITFAEKTVSTNDDLRAAAKAGAPDYTVRIAGMQTGGRGREGRSFFSEGGLYLSILLPARADTLPLLTHIAAIAVARAIRESAGANALIKWVNDVYVEERKVSGILTENIAVGTSRRVIMGIGVNVNVKAEMFPPELRESAGAVFANKTELAAAILRELFDLLDNFSPERVKREYRELCFLPGRRVDVITEEGSRQAVVLGLTEELGLLVRYEDGQTGELIAGEVRLRLRNAAR